MYGNPNTHIFTFELNDAFRRVVNHAKASTVFQASFDENHKQKTPKPGIFLVKDRGVYLMSAGKPSDKVDPEKNGCFAHYANGHHPDNDPFESWCVGGDDFSDKIDTGIFDTALVALDKRREPATGQFQIKVTQKHLYFETFIRRSAG